MKTPRGKKVKAQREKNNKQFNSGNWAFVSRQVALVKAILHDHFCSTILDKYDESFNQHINAYCSRVLREV